VVQLSVTADRGSLRSRRRLNRALGSEEGEMKRWYLLYSFLFALYLALELTAFINVPQVPG
jgi:hypothetical protein